MNLGFDFIYFRFYVDLDFLECKYVNVYIIISFVIYMGYVNVIE